MKTRRPRAAVAAAIATALGALGWGTAAAAPSAPRAAAQQISRSTVVPRDGAEADTEAEPSVAVDPTNPDVAVAALQQDRFGNGAALTIGDAWSRDGGHTWHSATLPGITHASGGTDARVSDPVVAIGRQRVRRLHRELGDRLR